MNGWQRVVMGLGVLSAVVVTLVLNSSAIGALSTIVVAMLPSILPRGAAQDAPENPTKDGKLPSKGP